LAVAATIQALTVEATRGDGDRSEAGQPCEVRIALEALGARCLPIMS
jgi:hypothetical protein